jgi:hypothetical protein
VPLATTSERAKEKKKKKEKREFHSTEPRTNERRQSAPPACRLLARHLEAFRSVLSPWWWCRWWSMGRFLALARQIRIDLGNESKGGLSLTARPAQSTPSSSPLPFPLYLVAPTGQLRRAISRSPASYRWATPKATNSHGPGHDARTNDVCQFQLRPNLLPASNGCLAPCLDEQHNCPDTGSYLLARLGM